MKHWIVSAATLHGGGGGRGVMGDEERGAKHADKELRVQSNAGRLEPRPL